MTIPSTRWFLKYSVSHERLFAFCVVAVFIVAAAQAGCDYGSNNVYVQRDGESPGKDAQTIEQCYNDYMCTDYQFCNGVETCQPDSPLRSIKGCVAGTPPCSSDQTCVEDGAGTGQGHCESKNHINCDKDGDGHLSNSAECGGDGDDCDDNDPNRYTGNTEVCDPDNHDEDCDPKTFGSLDADNDGFISNRCCNVDDEQNLHCGNDCDDSNPDVHPGATELCDGLDNDCDGTLGGPHEDEDGDGYASKLCGGTDCDDNDPNTHPGAAEKCDGNDNDCSEGGGPAADEVDADGDGYVPANCDGGEELLKPNDCDDTLRTVHPKAKEVCNGIDDDCDGLTDEGLKDCHDPVIQIDVGRVAGCAVRASGTVACWGLDAGGYLGTGATEPHETARNVIDPRESDLLLKHVKSVALGYSHTCALLFDGRVVCWGDNGEEGRLGIGSDDDQLFLPQEVVELDDIVDLSVGGNSACVVRSDGTVWCWGDNAFGQLGNGTTQNSNIPVQVPDLTNVAQVECGDSFTCALSRTGAITCWGDMGADLPKGFGAKVDAFGDRPSRVFETESGKRISATKHHACVVRTDGTAFCFGANPDGQLGNGRYCDWEQSPQTVLSSSLDTPVAFIVDVATGGWISTSYEWTWDEVTHQSIPTPVETVAGLSCARVANGQIYCWGSNEYGALGIGNNSDLNTEDTSAYRQNHAGIPIDGIDAVEVKAMAAYACARTSQADVWCWGGGPNDEWTSYAAPHQITGFEE
jgi:alpha-tubulin suppressor-like RCC1 family protein